MKGMPNGFAGTTGQRRRRGCAGSDLACEQALSTLHARVVAALCGWTPDAPGLGEPVERSCEFELYDAEDSVRPAGEFRARFEMLALAPPGAPYA